MYGFGGVGLSEVQNSISELSVVGGWVGGGGLDKRTSWSDLHRVRQKEIQAKSSENIPSKLKKPEYHTSKYPKPKNLVCNLCEYRVHRNDLLKLHMNSKHNMEKFFCAVQGCGRYYSSKINLKHHKKVNHDCEVCGISLPCRDDLKLHKKQWHTNQ